MRVSFLFPLALLLLLAVPLLWLLGAAMRRAGYVRLQRGRNLALTVLRSVILAALVLALAGVQVVRPVDNLALIFLVDGSDSVAPTLRQEALNIINAAIENAGPADRVGVILFGENAVVERAPAEQAPLGRLASAVLASRTDIEAAIRLGMVLFPADAQKRLVLLSDGRENNGRAVEAARLAAARGIPIDVVPLVSSGGPDAQVLALDAPDVAREGQEVRLTARLRSSFPTSGDLQVFVDNELIGSVPVDLPAGETTVPLTAPGGEGGFQRFEVRLEAQGDSQPLNNRAAAFTEIQGPPTLLLITAEAERAVPLRDALEATNIRAEIRAPGQVSAEPTALAGYDAIVLVDVPARFVPSELQQALPAYVRDQGGSLAMIGGTESFGAGGWRRSPVAEVLPVELEPRDRQQRPDLALALVIDRSGSMSERVGPGLTKLSLAKEAVYQASLGLDASDQMGVVIFDTVAEWIMPMQQLPSLASIETMLSQFGDGGGTDIRTGIEVAAEGLAGVDARTKHVILLTDGLADSNYADLIDQMRADGVTITVVSIGADANPQLAQIAERGGGRFERVINLPDVPQIFLAETVLVAGRDIVEETFTPQIGLPTPLVRGLEAVPPLHGFNATEPRDAARTILVTPDGKPILAQWQYGLGRSIAWTSDFKGQWGRDWIEWAEFPRFVGGLVDALLPPQQLDTLTLETASNGAQSSFELLVTDPQGQPVDNATIQGRLLDPERQSVPLEFSQVGVGRYRAVGTTDMPGVYLAQVAVLAEDGTPLGSLSRGLAIAYSPEYAAQNETEGVRATALLEDLARITDGRVEPPRDALFVPPGQQVGKVQELALPLLWLALLLWPLDIALRRLTLPWRELPWASAVGALRTRLNRNRRRSDQPASDPLMTRLRTARERARRAPARAEVPAPASPQQPASAGQQAAGQPTQSPAQPAAQPAEQQQSPARTDRRKPAPAQSPVHTDEALASLLASRQRARREQRRNE